MDFSAITLSTAGVLGLLGAALAIQVIVRRVQLKIEAGDGGHPIMAQAIRAYGNFAEHAPLAVILLFAAELAGAPVWLVLGLAATLVAGRILSAVGLSRSLGPSFARQAGASLSILALIGASTSLLVSTISSFQI